MLGINIFTKNIKYISNYTSFCIALILNLLAFFSKLYVEK